MPFSSKCLSRSGRRIPCCYPSCQSWFWVFFFLKNKQNPQNTSVPGHSQRGTEIFSLFSRGFLHPLEKVLTLVYCGGSLKMLLFIYCYTSFHLAVWKATVSEFDTIYWAFEYLVIMLSQILPLQKCGCALCWELCSLQLILNLDCWQT